MEQYYVIILVAVVLVLVVIRALVSHFVCPNCGSEFKVNPLAYILAPHSFGKRLVKCPNCGKKSMLSPKTGKGKE